MTSGAHCLLIVVQSDQCRTRLSEGSTVDQQAETRNCTVLRVSQADYGMPSSSFAKISGCMNTASDFNYFSHFSCFLIFVFFTLDIFIFFLLSLLCLPPPRGLHGPPLRLLPSATSRVGHTRPKRQHTGRLSPSDRVLFVESGPAREVYPDMHAKELP